MDRTERNQMLSAIERRESPPPVKRRRGVVILVLLASLASVCSAAALDADAMKAAKTAPPVLRLSLDDALGMFLRQNFDLIISGFGIDYAKGQQITARLFPNPTFFMNLEGSHTIGLARSGQISPAVNQLFEMAGKRGYRIESAAFGARTAEANFEDAIRQLSFTVKDAYYRVQMAQRRLALSEENRDRFARILDVNTIRFKKGYIAEVDLIRIRLQVVDF